MSIAYGQDVGDDARFAAIAHRAVVMLGESTNPGAQIVNAIPIRERFGFKQT